MSSDGACSTRISSRDRNSSTTQYDVTYSCGACGYALNLNSSDRNTANMDSKYHKSVKKGTIFFLSIDDSRFAHNDELRCMPFFSKQSSGFFRRSTKLLCRKCGNHIGNAYNSHSSVNSDNLDNQVYRIKINALQPSESGTPLT